MLIQIINYPNTYAYYNDRLTITVRQTLRHIRHDTLLLA